MSVFSFEIDQLWLRVMIPQRRMHRSARISTVTREDGRMSAFEDVLLFESCEAKLSFYVSPTSAVTGPHAA